LSENRSKINQFSMAILLKEPIVETGKEMNKLVKYLIR
jgi:hypothetical protein